MSVQSSSAQNGHIWQNKELNPDTTSVCFVNRKFVNEYSPVQLNDCIARIEKESKCSIVIHGQKSEVIWFCIKHELDEQRRIAFNLINQAINYSLNEVKLPKLIEQEPEENLGTFRLSSPSPPPPSNSNQTDSKQPKQLFTNLAQSHSFSSRKETTTNTSNVKKAPPKSSMTRSTTESFISSLSYNKSTPFCSNLKEELSPTKFTNHKANIEKRFEKLKLDNKYKLKNRYTVDFLLQRADTVNSKKQPSNWKELSDKYPNVCFSGKVISYFDPYKYHEHWDKTKNTNTELHNNDIKYPTVKKNNSAFGYHHTDDFLNLNSFHKDLNNNYYSSFKQPRMNMLHSDQKHNLKRFDSLHYNNSYNNNNNQNIDNGNYYVKKQQQQIDMRHSTGYQHENSLRKPHPLSKTHSIYNFNN